MSKNIKFDCDVCKKEFATEKEVLCLQLTVSLPGQSYGRSIHGRHICPSCLEKLGIELPEAGIIGTGADDMLLDALADFVNAVCDDRD